MHIHYSPDSKKLIYTSYEKEKGMYQVINGKRVSDYYKYADPVIFSVNSKDYVYQASKMVKC